MLFRSQAELLAKGVGTRKDYDNSESQLRQLRSRQASLEAQEKVNELAARPDEIAAARSLVEQNQANLAIQRLQNAQWYANSETVQKRLAEARQ